MTHTLSPDRQRDVKIAEALGLTMRELPGGTFIVRPDDHQPVRELPRYSTDPVAFEALLQEIGRRGLGPRYLRALVRITLPDAEPAAIAERAWIVEPQLLWQLWSAPQSTKAAAALAVLTEATNG